MEHLSDPAKIKLAVTSGLKEMIDCPKLSHRILGHIVNDLENAVSLFDEKSIILAIQSLTFGSENLNQIAKSGVQKLAEDGELTRSERHLYSPHFDKSAETPESIESALLEIKKLYKSDGESDAGSEQIQSWLDEAQKLHDAWANVINQRNEDKIEWAAAEEKRAAGINYALSQTGLYSAREEFRTERYKNIKMPLYIYQDYATVAVSDFELEQTIFESENREEWEKVRNFVQERANQLEEVATSESPLARTELTNERWQENRTMFSEFRRPDTLPKLPIE